MDREAGREAAAFGMSDRRGSANHRRVRGRGGAMTAPDRPPPVIDDEYRAWIAELVRQNMLEALEREMEGRKHEAEATGATKRTADARG